jgi:hypothetical protein
MMGVTLAMRTYIPQSANMSVYKWDDVSNQLRDTTLEEL